MKKVVTTLWMVIIALPSLVYAGTIMTVQGPIPSSDFGKALVHEHIMVDFIGADKTGPHRYSSEAVVKTMSPHLDALHKQGFKAFVECTPQYLGRDPRILKRLSQLTGLHVVTNTGYYGASNDIYLPPFVENETPDQIAVRWIKEWEEGIGCTDIKPGFMKIAVDPGPLSVIDKKLVQAAAKAHLKTGLTIACHTGEAQAARELLQTIIHQGVAPSALIIVHADGISDTSTHFELARAGTWVEYDGINTKSIKRHVKLIKEMIDRGYADRLLISHDAGWYRIGEPEGGRHKIRPYTVIHDLLIPALRSADMSDEAIQKLLVTNPARAFSIKVRKTKTDMHSVPSVQIQNLHSTP